MRNKSTKYYIYVILGILLLAIGYTACKDITPIQKEVKQSIELKLTK